MPDYRAEMAFSRALRERAQSDGLYLNFIGAGFYEHHIPAAVTEIAGRCEFAADDARHPGAGSLRLLHQLQDNLAALTGLSHACATLPNGASALAEAALMAAARRNCRKILLPATLNPLWRGALDALLALHGIELIAVPYCTGGGDTVPEALQRHAGEDIAALVIQHPNFFGVLEEVDDLTDWAHARGILVIAAGNPLSLGLLKPPGAWGQRGADIAAGEAQALGLALGGGRLGFLCCKAELAPHLAGEVAERDAAGNLRLRQSALRCSTPANWPAPVAAVSLYLSLSGGSGLEQTARACHDGMRDLAARLTAIPGVEMLFSEPVLHECVFTFDTPAADVLRAMEAQGILAGLDITPWFPELGNALLMCVTETHSAADREKLAAQLQRILARRNAAPACTRMKPTASSKW